MKETLLDLAERLERLIKTCTQNEHECRTFLPHIVEDLCHERPNSFLRPPGIEEPTRFGRSDYVVSAEVSRSGVSVKCAFVWELKAPQAALYEQDDHKRRFRPTKDLIKAETQLIHYVADQQESTSFKEYYGLTPRSPVIPAGILIGSDERIIKGKEKEELELDRYTAAQQSIWLREQYFYSRVGIRVQTWDWVVRGLRNRAENRRLDLSGTIVGSL